MNSRKMVKPALLALTLAAALGGAALWTRFRSPAGPATAAETIERFYRDYFRHYQADPRRDTKAPTPPLSRSFITSLEENARVCALKAGTDVCGWGADGDVYFDSQEYDPALTYENSRLKISEPDPGEVAATFNVYPSLTNAGTFYDRTLVFKMVREADKWVVDDLLVGGKSRRHEMEEETRAFLTAP